MPDAQGFYMVFKKGLTILGGGEIKDKYYEFLRTLVPYGRPAYSKGFCRTLGTEKVRSVFKSFNPHKPIPKSPEVIDSFGVKMFNEDSEELYVNFDIRVHNDQIWFTTDTPSALTAHSKNTTILMDLFFDLASKLDPLYATDVYVGDISDRLSRIALLEIEYEYYREPYFFCLEPARGEPYHHDFLKDRESLKKIEEIKKVLPRSGLVDILKQHATRVVIGKEGVGVKKPEGRHGIKAEDVGLREGLDTIIFADPIIYPRYFVRKVVRAKGVDLPQGITERCAKKLGIK